MRLRRTVPFFALPLALAACEPGADTAPVFEFNQGPLVSSAARPVPISGGTLLVTRDKTTAVATDPERDMISIVDLATGTVRASLMLRDGDEPGRLAEDFSGHVHVALRRGGGVVDVDLASASIVGRYDVCAAPRGIAYDPYRDVVHVACSGGELVSLDRTNGETIRSIEIEGGDLRDVIVSSTTARSFDEGGFMGGGDHALLVTRFKSAALVLVNDDGSTSEQTPPSDACGSPDSADVAWRTVELGQTGQLAMLHQRARSTNSEPVAVEPGGYGGGGGFNPCASGRGIVRPALSVFQSSFPISSNGVDNSVLAVDVASSQDGQLVAVAMPGNVASPFPQVVVGSPFGRLNPANEVGSSSGLGDVAFAGGAPVVPTRDPAGAPGAAFSSSGASEGFVTRGQAIAIAFVDATHIAVQTREPANLEIINLRNRADVRRVVLANDSRADTGQYLFHAGAGQMIACASCHPEGGDDGHVWNFASIGERRTQSIAGGLLGTEPFHWDGDMTDFRDLVTHVFTERMGAGEIGDDHKDALSHYVDRLTPVPPSFPADMSQVERGQELFESARLQCTNCHSGGMLTNNTTVDVGTGGPFQVPTLVGLGHRAPLMHNGCVSSIRDRFLNPCAGGDRHGRTSDLTNDEIEDITAFLKTL